MRFQGEQEEIVRNRPLGQKGLTLKEIRKMDYLNKVYYTIYIYGALMFFFLIFIFNDIYIYI